MKIFTAMLLGLIAAFPQVVLSHPVLDSLQYALTKAAGAGDRQEQVGLYMAIGDWYNQQYEHQSAVNSYQEALSFERYLDYNTLFQIQSELGYSYYWLDQYAEALEYLMKARKLGAQVDNISQKEVASNLSRVANVYVNLGDFDQAQQFQLESLHTSEFIQDTLGIADAYRILSRIYWYNQQLDKALSSAQQALRYYQKDPSMKSIYTCLASMTSIYVQRGMADSAEIYANRSQALADTIGYPYGVAFSKGMLGEIYRLKQNYPLAIQYITESIQLFDSLEIKHEAADFSKSLGDLFALQGQYQRAIDTLQQTLIIAKAIHARVLEKEIYKNLGEYYQQLEKPQQAYQYIIRYAALNDSLGVLASKEKMSQLQAQHEIQKRDSQIELLQQQHKLSNNRLFLVALGTVLALLLIILWLLYGRYRTQSETSEVLAKEKEEIHQKHEFLTHSHTDLQYFADIVSHDLHAAVHQMGEHTKDLETQLTQQEGLEPLKNGIKYIDGVLAGLFLYAASDEQSAQREWIDIGQLVKNIIAHLPQGFRGKSNRIYLQNLPTLYANPRRITQLFQHLLIHAIKAPNLGPKEIHVSYEEIEGSPRFSVRHNGAPILTNEIDQLFDLTFALENPQRNDCNCIGLVIAKKIVEQYEGSIWFATHTEDSSMCECFFTLPEATQEVKQPKMAKELST